MAQRSSPAGTFELQEMKLFSIDPDDQFEPIDIKKLVHTFTIRESVMKGYVSGEAKLYDSAGLFYNLPLRGQEGLHISISDFKYEELKNDFFVYSVDQVKPAKKSSNDVLEYVIKFVSIGKFISERYTVRRCIARGGNGSREYMPINEQVEILYDDYYKFDAADGVRGYLPEKEIKIHDTEGPQKIVIPSLSPDDSMHLLSRRAHSKDYPSDMFRFFETREKYNFVNLEELIFDEAPEYIYTYTSGAIENTPDGELLKMQKVLDLDLKETVNTFRVMKEGGYFRAYTSVDTSNRFASTYTYDHYDEMINQENFLFTDIHNPDTQKIRFNHTESFIRTHLDNHKRMFGMKDYPDQDTNPAPALRPQAYYGEIVNHKGAHLAQFDEYEISIRVYGTNELFPGKMILLDLPEFRDDKSTNGRIPDKVRSGIYMITEIQNDFIENTFYQTMTLIKSGLSDDGRR
jgi:hypothetical protein